MKFLIIACGGAIGAILRYSCSLYISSRTKGVFPFGTLFVNLVGALIIGILWGIAEERHISYRMKELIFIGILGAFTTFSTYSIETLNLIRYNEIRLAVSNVLVSNISGIVLAYVGYSISKHIL